MLDRDRLAALMGPMPEAAPLEPAILERVQCEGYVRELVEYAVEPGERIRAYLLLPDDLDRPAPLIFAHHQHNAEFAIGKSEVVGLAGHPDQAYAAELAQRGYVVIAPDAIAFEERNWSTPLAMPSISNWYPASCRAAPCWRRSSATFPGPLTMP